MGGSRSRLAALFRWGPNVTLRILCEDDPEPMSKGAPYPRPVVLELTCDGEHGLFEPTRQTFWHAAGFIAQHTAAMRAGWLERVIDGERHWFGPCCSGKTGHL